MVYHTAMCKKAKKCNINFDMNDASMIVALSIVYVLNP